MLRQILFFFIFFFSLTIVSGQRNVLDSITFSPHLSFSYAYQVPQLDLAERFGDNSNIGFGFHIKDRNNWYYGVQSTFIFGNTVTEPGLIQNLMTDNNYVIDNFGQIAEILVSERGYTINAEFGRLFPILGPNPNCGILVKAGVGFMQHKIRLEHQQNEITQLEGDYLKGYDRLTNGWSTSQFVGYYHMSSNRLLNFYVGAEAYQGFTEGRRDFNFDTQTTNEGARKDHLVGVRVGWVLHLYHRESKNILLR